MAANTLFIPYKVIDIHTALKSFQNNFFLKTMNTNLENLSNFKQFQKKLPLLRYMKVN